MTGINLNEGKIMACSLLYSGDLVPKDISCKVMNKLKMTVMF